MPWTVVLVKASVNCVFTRWLPPPHQVSTTRDDNRGNGTYQNGAERERRKTTMNAQALQPTHPVSPKPLLVGLAGAALAVVAGLGIATAVLDEPIASTQAPATVPASDYFVNGTDREVRGLMHRR
jgi:hypothetical protein